MIKARDAAALNSAVYTTMTSVDLADCLERLSDGIRALQSTDDPALNEESDILSAVLWANMKAVKAEIKRRETP